MPRAPPETTMFLAAVSTLIGAIVRVCDSIEAAEGMAEVSRPWLCVHLYQARRRCADVTSILGCCTLMQVDEIQRHLGTITSKYVRCDLGHESTTAAI
jgi:hypothetical protein